MQSQKESIFIAGWILWLILFFLEYGCLWLFGWTIIPADTTTYYESGSRHYGPSIIGMLVSFYICGWPLFGWVTLN